MPRQAIAPTLRWMECERCLISAAEPLWVELTDVTSISQPAPVKLGAAGIQTVEDLAEIDQRQTSVTGLSQENVARLRDKARTLLEAVEMGELTLVDGLGPSAAEKLEAAGVETIEELVELDLRGEDVEGLSTENLQRLKQNAAYLVPG